MSTPFSIPETLGQAKAILRHLNITEIDDDTLKTISAIEGSRFKEAITSLANKSGSGLEDKSNYVAAILESVSQETKNVIEDTLGFDPIDQHALITINQEEGGVFLAAIRAVKKLGDKAESEISYLNRLLSSYSRRTHLTNKPTPQAQLVRLKTNPTEGSTTATRSQASTAIPKSGNEPEPTETEKAFECTHIYGGKGAICFTVDTIRKNKKPTIRIEGTNANGERSYDWQNKIAIQLSLGEMVLLYGVLIGHLHKFEISGHGEANEKGMAIEDQGKHYFISLFCRGRPPCAVPAKAKDIHAAMGIIWDQIKANSPTQSDAVIQHHIKRTCEMHAQDVSSSATAAQKRA